MEGECESDFEGKILLVIRRGGSTRFQIYRELKRLGAKLFCFEREEDLECSNFFDGWILGDVVGHLDTVTNFVVNSMHERGLRPDGVITFDEFGVKLCSAVASALGLPALPKGMVECCQDKCTFRSFCKAQGLPHVRHVILSSLSDVDRISSSLSFPAVFKPRGGAGSHFVKRVDSVEDLKAAFHWALTTLAEAKLKAYEWFGDGDKSDAIFMAEEFIEGAEVDLDCVVRDGQLEYLSVVDNLPPSHTHFFMETGCHAPSLLPDDAQAQLKRLAQELLLRFQASSGTAINGALHMEMILGPRGPVPIEVNCRLGGAETRCMNRTVWGVDLGIEAARVALRLPPPPALAAGRGLRLPPCCHAHSANFIPPHSGRIACQHVPAARRHAAAVAGDADGGYVDHQLYFPAGAAVLVPPMGFQYLGWLVVRGPDAEAAAAAAARMSALFRFEIEADDGPAAAAAAAAAVAAASPATAAAGPDAVDGGREVKTVVAAVEERRELPVRLAGQAG